MIIILKRKKYDDKKLLEIFGDIQPVDKDIHDSVPKENTMHQRLLFGDFLRRYHHRLAYEIAKWGFPGECSIDLFEKSNIDKTDREIVGIIAFSHGVSLRSLDDYIDSYETDLTKNCPIFYLMSVLRIADYLNIIFKRAPEIICKKQILESPISQREFELNQSVQNITLEKEKKSYYINVQPTRTTIFYMQKIPWKKYRLN